MGIFDNMRSPTKDDRFSKQVIDAAEAHVEECGLARESIIWTFGPRWVCKICGDSMAVKNEIIPLG
jgi:hypothetical protein